MYRLFIEKTGYEYLRISLQYQKGKGWKLKEREYCEAGNQRKLQSIIAGYSLCYKIEPAHIIDTRIDYKDISWVQAALNELKLMLEQYVWKKRLARLKKTIIILHENSGQSKYTRRKYWIVTDWKGNPMLMNSLIKDGYKRKGYYSKKVDAIALDKECLWNTDNLYS
ncbi:MAG: hypothetical protein LBG31_01450 [Prevotellaceae bacterium]|jgi:hypothetical protein|nr:hypothetical protein [Prevotellaceae bacterium]